MPRLFRLLAWTAALVFFALCTWGSYAHWANFEYRTFDLAFYVQSLSQLLRGHSKASVLGVPLLGNHVEPIVFLILPAFFLFRHPMVLVVVQNLALAAMAPLAFHCSGRLGLSRINSLLLAIVLLITPATGYVALHEFHPEALAPLCLLLMVDARLRGSLRIYWVAVIALLACKENMALLVAAYCAVHLLVERKRAFSELRRWYLWPLVLSILWFALCAKVITPALNSDGIDYMALYDRLGKSAGEILANSITNPQRIIAALGQSLRNGNLLWALLLPYLGLSLLTPRWLLIGAPILLQHLLSWRSSEWQIYFHYAAPLIPLFWIGMAESVAGLERSSWMSGRLRAAIPMFVIAACVAAQILLGPAGSIASSIVEWSAGQSARARKLALIHQIPPSASVVAPLPYLSHLAMRENLYSLHFILKGLKTLSRSDYAPPPPTDFVLIDYDDSATFDPIAGYYHPTMKTADDRVIPSSDRLLHDFLKRATWKVTSSNELTLLRMGGAASETPVTLSSTPVVMIDPHTTLNAINKSTDVLSRSGMTITMHWSLQDEREMFPWMLLRLTPQSGGPAVTITHGLCSPESSGGDHVEDWRVTPGPDIPAGDYNADALFVDYPRILWAEKSRSHVQLPASAARVSLGQIKVIPTVSSEN
jgi:uncharacterized membrane protein